MFLFEKKKKKKKKKILVASPEVSYTIDLQTVFYLLLSVLTTSIELGYFLSIWFGLLLMLLDFRFELAEECADDDEAKLAISELRKGVLEELKMHNSFVQVR